MTTTAGNMSAGVEAPSGKGAADENFPVGSFLLPKRLRPHVATYYAFARAIDDIADRELAAAEQMMSALSSTAPGTAEMIGAQAGAWVVRSQAYTQQALAEMLVLRPGQRLSVQPVETKHYVIIKEMAQV